MTFGEPGNVQLVKLSVRKVGVLFSKTLPKNQLGKSRQFERLLKSLGRRHRP
jgi:hypothetical protein